MSRTMYTPEVMMMIRKLKLNFSPASWSFFLLMQFGFGFTQLHAQEKDFQVWPSLQMNLEVLDNFRIHLEEEVRFHENLSQVSRQINDFGASYRFNKYLKAGLFYRMEADWKNADEYAWRSGLHSDLSVRTDINRFTVGYRLRVQSSKVERNKDEDGFFNGFRHRHKISADYDIKGIPLVPFIEAELFVDHSAKEKSVIKGYRAWAGLDYTINKIHTISLKYGIDQELNTSDPLKAYVVAAGYAIDLRLGSVK